MSPIFNGVKQQAVSTGGTVTGSDLNDILTGISTGARLVGGLGDDTYYVMSSDDVVVEGSGGGEDTVITWRVDYTLGANVENLFVYGLNAIGVGNELDNHISGGEGRQQLFGGGGNDTVTGGAGSDTFIVRVGSGSDTITDFETGSTFDMVQLGDYSFMNFKDVVSHMRAVGSSVVLQLSETETLTFLNKNISDFSQENFQYALDRSALTLSFSDDFNNLSLQENGGTWRTWHDNSNESQLYLRANNPYGVNPFSIKDGVLTIRAEHATAEVTAATGEDYVSGIMSTRGVFSQTYGYFEIRADLPSQNGVCPAFWLLPANGSWPPELDVVEQIRDDPSRVYLTAHSASSGSHTVSGVSSWIGDTGEGMHTYGLLWTPDELIWYLDGAEAYRMPTPADMHQPMYMVVSMAVGTGWVGTPDADFVSADYDIDYVRAYQLNEQLSTEHVVTGDKWSITLDNNGDAIVLTGTLNINATGNAKHNTITGNSGNNIIDGKEGADTMRGGAGNDTYYVDNAGDIVIEYANEGLDRIYSSVSRTLSDYVEELVLTGKSGINATGNDLDNFLKGNDANNILDGGAGADRMEGGAGDDIYYVDNVGDIVTEWSNGGTDTVRSTISYVLANNVENLTLLGSADINATGNWHNNVLIGNTGNNILDGGSGADRMEGGLGDDTYYVDNAGDVVIENADEGVDTVYALLQNYTLGANVENLVLASQWNGNGTGNALNNRLTGNAAANILDGRQGADIMAGGAGDDTYYVDNAGDIVIEYAGEGSDRVYASVSYTLSSNVEELFLTGNANISACGNNLDNILKGNDGNNVLNGAGGADRMEGGLGDDIYCVDNVNDVVVEWSNGGTDTVRSTVSYSLSNNVENLTLLGSANINATGNAAYNTLIGNDGDNILDGGAGGDRMEGGLGNDIYYVDHGSDVVVEWSNGGVDTVRSTISYTLGNNVENLTLLGAANINATGNWLNNVLVGNSGNNILDGGAGADRMEGGLGNDTYYVDNAGDIVIENANGGVDTVYALVQNYTLTDNVENLVLATQWSGSAIGNALDNRLTGNASNNSLDGKSGADIMAGGGGDDYYYVDNIGDVVIEKANEGTDRVNSSVSWTLSDNVEELVLLGNGNINATGNGLNNFLRGNDGNNVLNGGAGADRLEGGLGDDIYYVDNAGDVVVEWSNSGIDTVRSTISYALANNVENLTLLGTANINATGNWSDNVLTGNSGNNILNGGSGNDRLIGGAGADVLTGGAGNDTFVFLSASDSTRQSRDTITDFQQGDRIDLSGLFAGSASYLNTGAFTGHAGEVQVSAYNGGVMVNIDVNGDKIADSEIFLANIGLTSLRANGSDFIL